MKYILPIFILLFVTGCTLPEFNQATPSNQKKRTVVKKPVKQEPKEKIVFKYIKQNVLQNDPDQQVHTSLNQTILSMADQLFSSNISKKNPLRVILTSFVDLNNLNETTPFGRILSESMFNELHVRKFKITDFRGQESVSVNADGEFHITRDVEKLKDNINGVEFILVGTYSKFEDQSLIVNARIVDSISGNVVSSARVVYQPKDCKVFDVCEKPAMIAPQVVPEVEKPKPMPKEEPVQDKTPVMIVEDK
jgi:TolB-like protein